MTFDELATERKQLQLFCYQHAPSLQFFRSGLSYKLTNSEQALEGLEHLTSTATCIESLLTCPAKFRSTIDDPRSYGEEFAHAAIERPDDKWKSEDSAAIYCRCRGLPLTIRCLPAYDDRIERHVDRILAQLQETDRFAIGEADIDLERRDWYPPNAFHTFWTLEILDCFKERFPTQYEKFSSNRGLERTRGTMLLWIRRTLGFQLGLHSAGSSVLDSDQLAWALTTLLRFEEDFPSHLADQDLLRESLKQLFSTQLEVGTWRHYRSLFHYRKAGNAYCYVYETFAALIGTAVNQKLDRKFLRDCLSRYRENLHRLWDYAVSTKVQLPSQLSEPSPIGWCSGHRLNQVLPESWATASVFAFAQAYRRLLGVWTREAAVDKLNIIKPRFDKRPDKVLEERGNSWIPQRENETSVLDLLYTLYINPVLAKCSSSQDPDDEVLDKNQARSAILFGPPGASKTTLARALALSIGWQYVEIHANHFVAGGMEQIHSKADEIFRRLMELDSAVILFDEIDELVREREGGHEAFRRFLTTSMLPKLAELWQQRKTLYFVATNHIKYFDRAITRSERFDALILVAPPSYEAKIARLKDLLGKTGVDSSFVTTAPEIWSELKQAGDRQSCEGEQAGSQLLREDHMLAKFVLLRYDQLSELAENIRRVLCGRSGQVDTSSLRKSLSSVRDRNLALRAPYLEFLQDIEYPRQDSDKYQVWRIEGLDATESLPSPVFRNVTGTWLKAENGPRPPKEIQRRSVEVVRSGVVSLGPEV